MRKVQQQGHKWPINSRFWVNPRPLPPVAVHLIIVTVVVVSECQEETMIVEAKKIVEEEPIERTIAEADLPKGSWARMSSEGP